ncbi:MAG: hypothetical protein H0T75_18520 [Rhizobiales bacterium]|nr:hypothetical protein [Hyphomicrobiales bacterium]MDQ3560135.1 hypothetical protein [Pseudomonadota bacterium]
MPRSKTLPEPEEWKFKEPGEDLEYDTWFKEQVQIGLDQLARGETVSDEIVREKWRLQRAELLRTPT